MEGSAEVGQRCVEGSRERGYGSLNLRRDLFSHKRREERQHIRFEGGQMRVSFNGCFTYFLKD